MTQGTSEEYIIGDRLLGFGGDTILGIYFPGSNNFHTLISFWTVRNEDIFIALLTGILVALPAAIIGALLTYILTRSDP